jgi:predicted amidophosphoribosyltransferase
VFCSKCGEKVGETANFCPKCGARTIKATEAGVVTPKEELKEAFSKMGEEIEKAFSIAAKEIKEAFKTAREEIREAISPEPIACSYCREKNMAGSQFCYKCGKKLE